MLSKMLAGIGNIFAAAAASPAPVQTATTIPMTGTPTTGTVFGPMLGNSSGGTTIFQHTNTTGPTTYWSTSYKMPRLEITEEGTQATIDVRGYKNVVFKTDAGDVDLTLMAEMLKEMGKILCMTRESAEKLEEYPALKAAFDQYKLVEAMVRDDDET